VAPATGSMVFELNILNFNEAAQASINQEFVQFD
jgi:hypothetical protein